MKTIINCETGETTERELNKAEKDQQKIDEAQIKAAKLLSEAEAGARAMQRQAILDKLGLTADEARLLLG
jgi:vacuolar-type H+-ATPase subunit H